MHMHMKQCIINSLYYNIVIFQQKDVEKTNAFLNLSYKVFNNSKYYLNLKLIIFFWDRFILLVYSKNIHNPSNYIRIVQLLNYMELSIKTF